MEWIEIKNEQPQEGQECLIYNNGSIQLAEYKGKKKGKYVFDSADFFYPCFAGHIHWMPLPQPPAKQ